MNDDNPPGHLRSAAPGQQVLRLLALITVTAGVLALAAAAFMFSYAPVYDIARATGIRAGLARFYPALPDAALVVACAAALTLRGARWWARWLVWLSIIALMALVGAADAVHAMAIELPRRPAAAAVAVLPWALLLLGFRLWLSVLRHTRKEQARPASLVVAGPADQATVTSPAAAVAMAGPAAADPGMTRLAAAAPAVADPVTAAPAVTGPAAADPLVAAPVAADPAAAAAVATEPDAAAPDVTEPAAAGPVRADAAPASPAAADPATTSPTGTRPAAVSPVAGAGAHDGSAPGATSAPVTLRGLDLILPPYPDEPAYPEEPRYPDEPSYPDPLDAERPDGARSENLADHEPARAEAVGPTHATSEEPVNKSGPAAVEAPRLAPEPGPELAIDADPGLDDPASDEGHSVVRAGDESGEEIGADAERLIGENNGRENSLAALAPDTGTDGGEPKSAIPIMPLGAPVPETVVPQPAPGAGDLTEAELPEAELPEAELPEAELPEAELPENEAPETEPAKTEPAKTEPTKTEPTKTEPPETGPAEPEAQEPDAPQSAAAAKEAADFLRVRSSPVPPENERRTRRRR